MADSEVKTDTIPRGEGRVESVLQLPWIWAMRALEIPMRGIQRLIGQRRMPWIFVLPNLLIFGTFVIVPLFINFHYSVTGGTDLFPTNRPFVGTDQYDMLLECENHLDPFSCREDRFWRGMYNTAFFVTFQVGFMVAISLITALVLNRKIFARAFFRSVFFYPVLLSPVVVALIWKWILQREGLLNAAMTGMGGDKTLWLVEPGWAMFWAICGSTWAHMGFYTLILLAGLQSIPKDLYEAAEMDGTSQMRTFWRITMPLLWPTMLVVLILALIKSVQTFDEIFVLTGGGPGTATQLIVQYIYETGFASQVQNFGLAAASSIILGVVLLVLTLIQMRVGSRKGDW
ncbi:MAG: sugar ABC transporter permease [Rhodospirillales bacterium]|nr:sugar ABC transporter permease [Rhodospirillales bacterium]